MSATARLDSPVAVSELGNQIRSALAAGSDTLAPAT